MTDALVKIDSNGKDYYQANYRKLDAELAVFADSLRQVLAPVRGQAFVVWHPALSYFARDYGLEQIGIEYEGKEAPAGFVAEKNERGTEKECPCVFYADGSREPAGGDCVCRHRTAPRGDKSAELRLEKGDEEDCRWNHIRIR